MGELATLGRSGHAVAQWDIADPATVERAKFKFDTMVREQGFAAFKTIAEAPPEQIREFDPTADRIVLTTPHQGG